jgi:ABC-type multidrug transport system fused ATPase/permease subunit
VSHVVLFVQSMMDGIALLYQAVDGTASPASIGLKAALVGMIIVGLVACVLIPRRPHVFYSGQVVEPQRTVSLWSRLTYSWCSDLLRLAYKREELNMSDLAAMDHFTRAEDLHENIRKDTQSGKYSLLREIVYSHRPALIMQNILTVAQGFGQILPQIAMYQLLRVLELRDKDSGFSGHLDVSAGLWVVGLGLGLVIEEFLSNWMWWVSNSQLQVPLRVQLSAIIFTKSLRRKDVKGVSKKEKSTSAKQATLDDGSSVISADSTNTDQSSDSAEGEQKTKQGTINLVGVDAERVAMFGTFSNLFLGSIVKLTVTFVFLGILIGGPALAAGLVAQALTLPLNTWAARRYTNQQQAIMKARDQKLVVLSEALSGIRQIKFSALEKQWETKIRAVREEELQAVWISRWFDFVLTWLWILGPILLSAVSLSVYATLNGGLEPSVAFTTIATLTSIEATLGGFPEIITMSIDALVSMRRIEAYLTSPEKVKNTESGDSVAFQDATVAWPSDEEIEPDAFQLKDIDVSFPKGELSVISGPTGSGKSLMLLAILGEAEVLSGKVIVPEPPKAEDRHDSAANKSNWIIPEAVAFVSQQPWIENASFKDNILFGLPFDEDRYKQVISCCALEKDLEMLIDGSETELGANGVNISGGQKWRITMARALYSRAGVLVMDDVLSAVDAHVGRHLFENALTGPLATGRTRILVSHHVTLLLPKTQYQVRLANGRVESAGFVEDLKATGQMDHILQDEQQGEEAIEDDEAGLMPDIQHVRTHSSNRGRLTVTRDRSRRRSSRLSNASRARSTISETPDPKAPRKFTEEEQKEKGRVKWHVYGKYISASGGLWFWSSALLLYMLYQGVIVARVSNLPSCN